MVNQTMIAADEAGSFLLNNIHSPDSKVDLDPYWRSYVSAVIKQLFPETFLAEARKQEASAK
jgi:hypothetical protein